VGSRRRVNRLVIDYESLTVVEEEASTAAAAPSWWGRFCGCGREEHDDGEEQAEKRVREVVEELGLAWLLPRPAFPRGIAGTAAEEEWKLY